MKQETLESKWLELADVPMYEDEAGRLCLENDWWIFDQHTDISEIWHYFDDYHPKGVAWLMYNMDAEPVRGKAPAGFTQWAVNYSVPIIAALMYHEERTHAAPAREALAALDALTERDE